VRKHIVNLVAVDTGLNALGWAVWHDAAVGGEMVAPHAVGVIEMNAAELKLPWEERASAMMQKFSVSVIAASGIDLQVMEMPEFRPGSAVGHAAAAQESLGMLYFMCGMHKRTADCFNIKTKFARVSEWKGNMKKELVARRIAAAIGAEDGRGNPIESHAWDAVGIGLWALGHRLDDSKKFGRNRR